MQSQRHFILTTLVLLLSSCGGDADFGSPGGRRSADGAGVPGPQEPPPPVDSGATSPISALTWFWQCESAPAELPKPGSDKEVVVEGTGPHEFAKGRLNGTPVTFSGKLCEPAAVPRDIVFVIDTSGSMGSNGIGGGNDPRIGDTCGRLTALRAVMAAVPAGQARFGLVTFNSGLDRSSVAMHDTQDLLFADIAQGGNIADVVCNTVGGTNYDAGLQRAQILLETGRAGATKEVYFVSDGQPNTDQDGIALATLLKGTGVNVGTEFMSVSIATVMLAGVDTVLETAIASRDADGKPLHAYVANTADLSKALSALTNNAIVGGSMKYRAIGAMGVGDWTALDLLTHLQGFNFTLPSISIDMEAAQSGVEVLFEYWDKHDKRYSTGGKLLWKADDTNAGG